MNQALQDFFHKLAADAALQAACSEAVGRGDIETIVRLGAEAGFSFTVEDLKQAWASQSAELDEKDLDQVAGGVCAMCVWVDVLRHADKGDDLELQVKNITCVP